MRAGCVKPLESHSPHACFRASPRVRRTKTSCRRYESAGNRSPAQALDLGPENASPRFSMQIGVPHRVPADVLPCEPSGARRRGIDSEVLRIWKQDLEDTRSWRPSNCMVGISSGLLQNRKAVTAKMQEVEALPLFICEARAGGEGAHVPVAHGRRRGIVRRGLRRQS